MNIRGSGILLHITSLPSEFGIGDLGPSAYNFADFLAETNQSYWQILPLNPTMHQYGHSPYTSPSSFAGNVLLISLEFLVEDGLLQQKQLSHNFSFSKTSLDYKKAVELKMSLLEKAYRVYLKSPQPSVTEAFNAFKEKHAYWLNDYALFMTLHEGFGAKEWNEWKIPYRDRDSKSLKQFEDERIDDVEREKFLQYLFYKQWERLKAYVNKKNISIIGDIPFYAGFNSADVWSNQEIFKLDYRKQMQAISGVPPDYYSETGQLWNTPVYNWQELKKSNYKWWLKRVKHNLQLYDILRLDHFRAFSAYWEVPAGEKTAINGKWVKSPGKEILSLLKEQNPKMPIIAEDLGDIDEPVRELMRAFNLPGMRPLQFAFSGKLGSNPYLPHNHEKNSIVYTGTHDNNTSKGWYRYDATREEKQNLELYVNQSVSNIEINEMLCRLAMISVACIAILPMQDVLGLGQEAMMNKPGTVFGNWKWRMKADEITPKIIRYLKEITSTYGRENNKEQEKK